MNSYTSLDELASDLENSISDLKKEQSHWNHDELENSRSWYQRKINLHEQALTKVFEIKSLLTAIERGF